jgi:hypothetical protein
MALIVKDRVRETSTTTGTGTITLAGASTGFRSFADIGNANTTYYCISNNNQFEVGVGTYTASGTTLSRDTVLSNSLGTTALIDFSAGTKDVFVTYPSDKAILGTTSAVASTGTGSVVLSASPTLTGAVSFDDGSAALPSITNTGDTNTGIFFPAADTIAFSEGGVEAMRIDSSGNLGIGISSPAYKLHSATNIGTGSTGNNGYIGFKRTSDGAEIGSVNTNGTNLVVNTGLALAFQTAGTERMRMHNSGGFSIGNTTDSGAGSLNTSADATINSVKVGRGAGNFTTNLAVGADALTGSNTGQFNLAVGAQTLTVNTTGQQNVAVGQGASYYNTNGSFNTSVGTAALQFVTAGSSNTAVGNQALVVTTGSNNIAIGRDAGRYQADGSTNLTTINNSVYIGFSARGFNNSDNNSIVIGTNAIGLGANTTVIGNASTTKTKLFGTLETVGDATINGARVGLGSGNISSNIAFGNNALNANTTGNNNVGIGSYSLYNNTLGVFNTAIGKDALVANTIGGFNTAIGFAALHNCNTTTTGASNNTAVGVQTLQSITIGYDNTAIGKSALQSATGSTTYNTAIGCESLRKTTSGTSNTALGTQAGNGLTTGSSNVFVGGFAGITITGGSDLSNPINCVFIGNNSKGSTINDVNSIVIGQNAQGLGSNTTVIGKTDTILTKVFGAIQSTTYTVATLPSASTVGVGARAFVTDASTPVFGTAVAGGGAVPVPVYSTGSAWNVG